MNIQKTLQELGLNEKEVDVYTTLLKIGTAKVAIIARKSTLHRTTVYDIISQLVQKGLVSKFIKGASTYYTVTDPRLLATYLDREQQKYDTDIKKKKERLDDIMPDLFALAKESKTRPSVKFFEGKKGIREAYEDTLSTRGLILAYADISSINAGLGDYFPDYLKRRVAKKINAKAIVPDTKDWRERVKKSREELREVRFLPVGNEYTPEINLYDNKMLMVSWKEEIAIIIESHELIHQQKIIYEQLWARLPAS